MIDVVAGKLPIVKQQKNDTLFIINWFELVKALSHNFALSCKQIEVYYHTNNNSTDAYTMAATFSITLDKNFKHTGLS